MNVAAWLIPGHPLRAKDICQTLGIATTANHTEGLRAKLKRLVTRDVLTEDQPGRTVPLGYRVVVTDGSRTAAQVAADVDRHLGSRS